MTSTSGGSGDMLGAAGRSSAEFYLPKVPVGVHSVAVEYSRLKRKAVDLAT